MSAYIQSVTQAQTWSPANFLCTNTPPESPDKARRSSCNMFYINNLSQNKIFTKLIPFVRHLCFLLYGACFGFSPLSWSLGWVPTMQVECIVRSLSVASCKVLLVVEKTNDEGKKITYRWSLCWHFGKKEKNIYPSLHIWLIYEQMGFPDSRYSRLNLGMSWNDWT